MPRKHPDILSMWVVATLLACGLAAPSRGWAQGGFALGEPVRLTQGHTFDSVWSPDGSKILFFRNPRDVNDVNNGIIDLYVMNAD